MFINGFAGGLFHTIHKVLVENCCGFSQNREKKRDFDTSSVEISVDNVEKPVCFPLYQNKLTTKKEPRLFAQNKFLPLFFF